MQNNTFTDNGNTAHVFFTWFGETADPAISYPRRICVRNNTWGPTHGAYFDVDLRAEIPLSSGIAVDPAQKASITNEAFTRACSDDTTPPTTSITAPINNSTVSGTQTITASASDNVAIQSVAFVIDGTTVATDTTAPYTYSWNTTSATNASHTIRSQATDTNSNQTTSSLVTVTVSNTTTPPPTTTISSLTLTPTLEGSTLSSRTFRMSWL